MSATGNLADLVRAAAERSPDKAAFLSGATSTSWREVDAQVDAAAAALVDLGLQQGDRVGIRLPNTLEFPVAYFGVLRAGLVAVPLNPGCTAQELRWMLSDSGARAVVTDAAGRDVLLSLAQELPGLERVLVTDASWDELLDAAAGRQISSPAGGEDLAVLLYTSGTSGRPKGAMLPHRALVANLDQTARIEPPVMTADDVVLLVLPLFHVYGLNAALGSVARHGATGLLVERFDPVETLAELR
ncbi:MAG: AMP-binding protein, partial [Actinomycetota bacterium]|nr:AMP-binding protein [Actinomycetota bacterium]